MSEAEPQVLDADDLDELDWAILDYFQEGEDGDGPWGKATPMEVYRALEERGTLEEVGNPADSTVQRRVKRLSLSDYLRNKYDTGCYEFVKDPRNQEEDS